MRGIIQNNLNKEAKGAYTDYLNFVKANNHLFKVKKPQTTLSHKIEK